jgi:hypothetical protein
MLGPQSQAIQTIKSSTPEEDDQKPPRTAITNSLNGLLRVLVSPPAKFSCHAMMSVALAYEVDDQ